MPYKTQCPLPRNHSVYVKDHSAVIEDNKVAEFRVNCKITFEVFD